jgi:hypothetical protein
MWISRNVANASRVLSLVLTTYLVAAVLNAAPSMSAEESFKVNTRIAGPGKFVVEVEGSFTDHPERVQGLAQLYAAKFALKLGYGYFRITDTKRAIRCEKSKEYDSVTGGQAKVGNAFLASKKPTPGFLDAKAFVTAKQVKLLREPTKVQKQKVSATFVSSCLSKGQ